ncbi:beta-lactamase family protein [Methylobacterium sp. Leaf89]|uniref:beta-lactamase family protein n=1 Tax=Methylobacterium sp. Leaf89 TaxID=1736245 RepID=UPI000A71BCC5|nr:beta-lactamase family protein [Methylobacterium sp. Leaf89]
MAYADDSPRPRRMREPDALPFVPGMAGVVMDPSRIFQPGAFTSGGAGMVGTAGDVIALLEAVTGGSVPLLSPESVAEMGRDQIEGIAIEGSPGWGYGLGFSVLRDPAAAGVADAPGAWRWGGAYGHSWLFDRERGVTLVALTNTAFEGMWSGGRFPADLGRALSAAVSG